MMEKEVTKTVGREILLALRKRYEADIATALANIEVYNTNPTGIGDHADLVSAVDAEVTKLADAADKLNALIEWFRI